MKSTFPIALRPPCLRRSLAPLAGCVFLVADPFAAAAGPRIVIDSDSPQQQFGAARLATALGTQDRSQASPGRIARIVVEKVATDGPPIDKGGFQIARLEDGIRIRAADDAGAMYALLDLAEQVSMKGSLERTADTLQNPRFEFRAIKFNLPWSSYRRQEALQANMEACRDLEMWQAFLDMMAENRFNVLTLWSLHPWPYLVRSESYPKACSFTDAELEEWRTFWTRLFRMARDRGIDTYLVGWNIFVSEGFREHYGKGNVDGDIYHTDAIDSPAIRHYTRESITQVINEYPDLTGLALTLGEGMEGWDSKQQTEWAEDVFVRGIKAADRPIRFIYRAALKGDHTLNRRVIDRSGLDRPGEPIIVDLKFNWSHGHSSPTLIKTHGGGTGEEYWTDPAPSHHKMAWMVRNEDFFRLRWGQSDFIREHIAANGQEFVGGYSIGSECYIPARDLFHLPGHPHVTWKWAFERQWLFYLQWGRLLYRPETPDAVFEHAFDVRYGGGHGAAMTEAFRLASRTTQSIAGYFWWTWDYTHYTEGFLGKRRLLSLKEMMETRTTEPRFVSVREYGDGHGDFGDRVTPLELAERIDRDNTRALAIVMGIESENPTLSCEIEDVKAWCHLGFYFADKLRAAVAMRQGRKEDAVQHLEAAVAHWKALAETTAAHLQPSPLGHLRGRDFHWADFLKDAEAELDWARKQ